MCPRIGDDYGSGGGGLPCKFQSSDDDHMIGVTDSGDLGMLL